MISKEIQEIIISKLEKADDFYVPVKKLWKELSREGCALSDYESLFEFLKKDKRFEIEDFDTKQSDKEDEQDEEEMEALGFYSGPRVKLKSRKITKEDMQRITLKHAQNVIDNLVKAYQVRPEDLPPEKEDELIELMQKSKHLHEKIEEIFKKGRGKSRKET